MAGARPLADVARDLARLAGALADALQVGDLDAAERLMAERARCLAEIGSRPAAPADAAALAAVGTAVLEDDRRSEATLRTTIAGLRAELGQLATGARLVHAYLGGRPLAPGYVDRHD